jgi:uncharacterized membrane protein (Fun14 family)
MDSQNFLINATWIKITLIYPRGHIIDMNIESFSSVATIMGGGFFVSFLIGFFIKKIIKILMFVFGGILALLIYLQSQGMITVEVNVDKIQSSVEAIVNTIAANTTDIFPSDNNSSIIGNLDIPLTGSVAAGFMLGITRRG